MSHWKDSYIILSLEEVQSIPFEERPSIWAQCCFGQLPGRGSEETVAVRIAREGAAGKTPTTVCNADFRLIRAELA